MPAASNRTVADLFGDQIADELARWAIDALVEPPARIDTATTRLPARMVAEGREILDRAGVDWRNLKAGQRSETRERRNASHDELGHDTVEQLRAAGWSEAKIAGAATRAAERNRT